MAMRVRAADVASAKPDSPVRLRLAGKVAAGEVFAGEVTAGTCVRLFTGSPLPPGADAVVMQEETRVESDARRRGSDPGPGRAGRKCPVARGGRKARLDARRSGRASNCRPNRSAGRGRFDRRPRGTAAGGGFAGNRFGIAGAGAAAGARPDLRKQSHRPGGADGARRGGSPNLSPRRGCARRNQPGPGGRFQPMRCRRDFRRRFGW